MINDYKKQLDRLKKNTKIFLKKLNSVILNALTSAADFDDKFLEEKLKLLSYLDSKQKRDKLRKLILSFLDYELKKF
jgi:hypothetical protein